MKNIIYCVIFLIGILFCRDIYAQGYYVQPLPQHNVVYYQTYVFQNQVYVYVPVLVYNTVVYQVYIQPQPIIGYRYSCFQPYILR